MSTTSISTLLLFGLLSVSVFAQTGPAASAPPSPTAISSQTASSADAAELTQLLRDFLQGASRNDIAAHEHFWAEDLIYTSSAGRRRSKADIRRDVAKENASEAKKEEVAYTGEDIRIKQFGTTAIVAFELIGTTTKEGKTEAAHYLNTGTFLKREGKWQVVAWQATKKASGDAPKK